jgi:hypothetical protein
MEPKEVAKKVIDALPPGATLDDIMYALYVKARFTRGEEEIRQGKGVQHEEAKRRLAQWSE